MRGERGSRPAGANPNTAFQPDRVERRTAGASQQLVHKNPVVTEVVSGAVSTRRDSPGIIGDGALMDGYRVPKYYRVSPTDDVLAFAATRTFATERVQNQPIVVKPTARRSI